MSCVLTKRFGRSQALVSFDSSSRYSSSSHFSLRQVKYVYDWWKPTRASACIMAGLVKASERNTTSGFVSRTSCSSHSQKRTGFVCGLSTRKIVTPSSIQCRTMRSTSRLTPS